MIKIVAIGKKHEDWVRSGIERYEKRLKAPWNAEWILMSHSSLEGISARKEESQRILSKLTLDDYVILLDEAGDTRTSPQLCALLEQQFITSKSVVCVIGGAYGVSQELTTRANYVWSLSPLVFPHQLVRLILIEQLYRCQSVASGGKYHHE